MKSLNSTTSSNQILLLLVVVVCLALTASWGIRQLTPQLDDPEMNTAVGQAPATSVDPQPSHEESTEPVREDPTLATNPAKTPATQSTLKPTVVLPRQPLMINPEKLETECRLFVERLLKRLPLDPHALNLAAMYYSQSYQTAKADELWGKIIELKAEDPIVFHNWATNAIHQGDSERAIEILDLAEEKGMRDPQLDYQRAIALSNLGRDEEVEQLLKPLVDSKQMTAALWLQLGLSQIKLDNHAAARDSLMEAQKQGISNKPLLNGLITSSVRLRDREAAQRYRTELEALEEKITEFGQDQFQTRSASRIRTFSLGILGEGIEVYRLAGNLDDAEHTALRLLAIDPNQLEVCELLHRIYSDRDELSNQLVVLERMSELRPGYLLDYLRMAKTASQMGDHQRAEALLKLTISLGPEDATSWIAMAEYLMEQKLYHRAVWYIECALERDPNPQGQALLERAQQMKAAESSTTTSVPRSQPEQFPTVRALPVGQEPNRE